MKYYNVKFDSEQYLNETGLKPAGKIKFEPIEDKIAVDKVKEYIFNNYSQCFSEPQGALKSPYLVPGGGYTTLWDWDSFFMACAVDDSKLAYAKGSICNLLDNTDENGQPSKNLSVEGETSILSTPMPIQIQFAYIIAKRLNDFSWVEKYWHQFDKMLSWYDKNCVRNGYYVYRNLYGNGIDNNPAVYGRSAMSTSACDFISFMYREFCAMAKFAEVFNDGKKEYYKSKALNYKKFIQEQYYDQMDNCFYCIDCNFDTTNTTRQGLGWITYLKYRNFSNLFPLWAGLATKEQAENIKNLIMDENEFLSVCGVRTHTKADPIYNNVPMGDPSNWQGPVWGLSTFLTAYGLARYGYKDEAYEVAMRLIKTYALDIQQHGCIHEYYHGDSGQPLIRKHFMSWNMLALRVIDDILNGTDSTTFDLLD